MNDRPDIQWLDAPADEEYAAAGRYLELLYEPKQARQLMKKLKRADMAEYPAKDILRASGISILTVQAYDWSKQENEIKEGDPLSPILLVRQENGAPLIIADGFHRLCAVFAQNEQIVVPCKIV
ncbi:hypothetical protein E4K72_02290 [Oxalobacteraceae bacterium OM1]|nr:hypothetical protein E4K72_02290 [Oxalobacteraceae bacterium OM1]